jgi:hypothetical protein
MRLIEKIDRILNEKKTSKIGTKNLGIDDAGECDKDNNYA